MSSITSSTIDDSEPLMSVDKYYQPLVATDEDYVTLLLVRLILLEPGTIQTHPNMGVGLVSNFRYSTEVDMTKLSNSIKSQINSYLPQFTGVNVQCELDADEKVIRIYITSAQINALLPINTETGEVVSSERTLSDYK